jgi:hypothetical protein
MTMQSSVRYAIGLTAVAVACASPEAERTRGSGAGADPGNREAIVELHEGAEPFHGTPCLMRPEPCSTPPRLVQPLESASND